jgi:hypothetical protein
MDCTRSLQRRKCKNESIAPLMLQSRVDLEEASQVIVRAYSGRFLVHQRRFFYSVRRGTLWRKLQLGAIPHQRKVHFLRVICWCLLPLVLTRFGPTVRYRWSGNAVRPEQADSHSRPRHCRFEPASVGVLPGSIQRWNLSPGDSGSGQGRGQGSPDPATVA